MFCKHISIQRRKLEDRLVNLGVCGFEIGKERGIGFFFFWTLERIGVLGKITRDVWMLGTLERGEVVARYDDVSNSMWCYQVALSLCLSLSQIRIWFLMALARVLSKPDSHEKNLTNSIHIY